MSWNGSGVFNRIYSWVADKNAGIDISSSRMDQDTDDITSNGFGNTLTRDGQGSATANLPMNNFRHTGVGNAQARTDYAALGQVQDGVGVNWTAAGTIGDAMTATFTPAITALVDGQLAFIRAPGANSTSTPTFAPNGLTAHTITRFGGGALAAGDIPGNLAEIILRYNLANTRWELLNPATIVRWVVAGGSADALTATNSPPVPTLSDGQICCVRASAANATTTPTFAPDGLTAHTITKYGGTALIAGNIASAGHEIILRYNLANTRWELLNPAEPTAPPPPASFKNLAIKVATNTTATLTADFIVVTDGTKFQTLAFNQTINLGTTGANALDTGTIAIDTWYAIWAIAKPDGTVAGLASASFTAPTMPSGYTYKARVGAIQTIHGTATLYGTWQLGREAQYVVGLAQTTQPPNIGNGVVGTYSNTSPTLASTSVARFVPPTASHIAILATSGWKGSTGHVLVAPNTSYGGANNGPVGSNGMLWPIHLIDSNSAASDTIFLTTYLKMLLESTSIAWAGDGAGSAISCLGWEDNI